MQNRKTKILSVVRVASGNFLEMYDFMVFGYYAAAIRRTFFPKASEFATLTILGLLRDHREKQKAARPVGPSAADRLAKLQRDEIAARVPSDGDLISMWDESKKPLLAIQAEIATLKGEITRAARVFPMPSEPTIRSFDRDVAEVGRAQDYATPRGLVERVVTRLIWEGKGNYTVEGRIVLAQN